MPFKSVSLFIVFAVLNPVDLSAQHASADSTFVDRSGARAIKLYNKSTRDQLLLYNGVEYKPFPEPYEGHPFFESEYVEVGSVFYDGELYENVAMQYDLLDDLLVLEHYDQNGYVALMKPHQDKIKSFRVLDHNFISIDGDSTSGILKDGFYELLYDGSVKVLAKRKKSVVRDYEYSQLIISFPQKNNYYLVNNGRYYPLKNKGALVKALQGNKKLLNDYARKNQLDFGNNKEKLFVALAAYHDQIRN